MQIHKKRRKQKRRNEVLFYLRHQYQVKREVCGNPPRGIYYIKNPCETIIIVLVAALLFYRKFCGDLAKI